MKNFNGYTMIGLNDEDNIAILKNLENDIDLTVDDSGRVWNSGGIWIADCQNVPTGEGILCSIKVESVAMRKAVVRAST